MAIDMDKVGATTGPFIHDYSWKDQALYALGIGAKRDDLTYLYEGVPGGMKVFPTYAVVPAYAPLEELLRQAGVDMEMVVHNGQKVVAHRQLPPSGRLETVGTLSGIYDLKRFASLVIKTQTSLGGEPVFDTEWSIIVRDAGGFRGPRPPKDKTVPKIDKAREPDWTVEFQTSPEQALLYRLSGDTNPLHADPAMAEKVGFSEGPILHGLCTYGHLARAVIQQSAGGDAGRLVMMAAQFRKPVWPGDVIVACGFELGDNRVALKATAKGRPDPVVTNAWAEIR